MPGTAGAAAKKTTNKRNVTVGELGGARRSVVSYKITLRACSRNTV